MEKNREQIINEFLKDFHRSQNNAIYFLEEYWNKVRRKNKLELTDEEKETIFKNNRIMVPVFDQDSELRKYEEAVEDLRKKGLKDWEIF